MPKLTEPGGVAAGRAMLTNCPVASWGQRLSEAKQVESPSRGWQVSSAATAGADNNKSAAVSHTASRMACGVPWIIQRDQESRFRFASLQSQAGRNLLGRHGLNQDDLTTLVLIDGSHVYTRSGAALRIARDLRGIWPVCSVLLIVPSFLRDRMYRFIANRRYRWFGKRESCMTPTEELRSRFVE